MPYFNDKIANIKLCVLYMLKTIDTTVTSPQLTLALVEAAELPYFDIQLAISELEENGELASVVHAYGTGYALSEKGKEFIILMEKNIPMSMRTACESYVRDNRLRISLAEQLSAITRKNPAGGYDAVLTSIDRDRVVLSVVINVADSDICETLCENWRGKSHEVYSGILNALMPEKE